MSQTIGVKRSPPDDRLCKRRRRDHCYSPINIHNLSVSDHPQAYTPSSNDNEPFDHDALHSLFQEYVEPSSNTITSDGYTRLCHDIGVNVRDLRTLSLAFHLQVEHRESLTRDEFGRLAQFRCHSIEELKKLVASFEQQLQDSDFVKCLYRFAFHWAKANYRKKVIDKATAIDLYQSYFMKVIPHVPLYVQYLQADVDVQYVNEDGWMGFLEFARALPDTAQFPKYDPTAAWPLLVDGFVGWYLETNRQYQSMHKG